MKLLTITHNSIQYEFRYLCQSKVIEISKGGLFTYLMKWNGRLFYCNCPGSRYRGKCWHLNMVKLLMMQDDNFEPWTEWAEEAGRMMYESNRNCRK